MPRVYQDCRRFSAVNEESAYEQISWKLSVPDTLTFRLDSELPPSTNRGKALSFAHVK
jgi:hypothetical protein